MPIINLIPSTKFICLNLSKLNLQQESHIIKILHLIKAI